MAEGDAVGSAGELLAQGLRRTPELRGDVRPTTSPRARRPASPPLVVGQPALETRRGVSRPTSTRLGLGSAGPPTSMPLMPAGLVPAVVPAAARAGGAPASPPCFRAIVTQEPHELLRAVDVELPQRGPHEEAPQHRLADVGRVEQPAQLGVAQAELDLEAEGRLVPPDQFPRPRRRPPVRILRRNSANDGSSDIGDPPAAAPCRAAICCHAFFARVCHMPRCFAMSLTWGVDETRCGDRVTPPTSQGSQTKGRHSNESQP